jgi:signal transduction histidine kinase
MRQEVTAMITHDLKTPLQSIRSFLEMLHHGMLGELNEQGDALLTLSEKESMRMVGLIDSVLQLERIRSGSVGLKVADLTVGDLLDKSADAVQVLADEKQIELKREYEQVKAETIQGDGFWLEQVLVNILSNAIKFSPPKTSVIVTVQSSPALLVIRISDKGPGIPKEERKLVFERFHRVASTSSNIAGSGLGLTISKELVELHHGTIDIESEVGSGSTFNIRLPRSKPAQDSKPA